MASATVFVDDAVLGRLPPVDVKTGMPTDSYIHVTDDLPSRGLGVAWILVALGPPGWVVLFLYACLHQRERLTVTVPMSESTYRSERTLLRTRQIAVAVCVIAGLAAFFLQVSLIPGAGGVVGGSPWGSDLFLLQLLAIALAGGGLITALFNTWDLRGRVRLELDASRRWVTLRQVHPKFAAAVAERQSASL